MQIDSFDKFLFEQIPSFIAETKGQLRMETNNTTSHANMHIRKKEVTIEMSDIRLHRPSQSTPMECRLRGHTYEGAVMVRLFSLPVLQVPHSLPQVSVTKRERNKDDNSDWSQTQERVTLCRIPTMLKSKVFHTVNAAMQPHSLFSTTRPAGMQFVEEKARLRLYPESQGTCRNERVHLRPRGLFCR